MSSHPAQCDYEYELISSYCGPSTDSLWLIRASDLNKHHAVLLEQLDLDFGLLDKLLSKRIISEAELKKIKNNNSMRWKQAMLLNLITLKSKFSEFYDALEGTQQEHLVNYSKSPGLYKTEFGLNWPLTEKQTTQLDRNQKVLVELLDISPELAVQLYSSGAITQRHKEYICSISSVAFRSTEFLDILRRRSFGNYKQTIECLRASKQRKAADILEEGVLAQMQLTWPEGMSAAAIWTPKECVERSNEVTITPGSSTAQSSEPANPPLMSVKTDVDEITSYIHLKTVSERLIWHENDDLRVVVENYVNSLLPHPLKIHWHEDDYRRCKGYFQNVSTKKLYDLPKEVMEMTLSKAFALHFWLRPRPSEQEIFASLSSICYFSFDILGKRRFKQTRLPYIRAYYSKTRKRSIIIRINRLFLLENIKPKKSLINRLYLASCLTKSQVALISRLQFKKEKNHELLKIARKLSAKQHFAFVECLYSNGQQKVADVLEQGGVVVRASMSDAKAFYKEGLKTDRINRIRQLLNKDFMPLYNLRSTELASIQKDKSSEDNNNGIVLWFWCKSKKELRHLEQKFNEFIEHLVNRLSYYQVPANNVGIRSTAMIADMRHFRKDVAIRNLVIDRHISGVLNLHCAWALAAASLGDEIYVLLFDSIYIYQGQPSFELQKKITIPPLNQCCGKVNEVTSHPTISTCQKSLCAYITCTTPGCVRKVTANSHVHSFWLSGIEHMRLLIVTSTGNVLILKARQESKDITSSFEFYSSEAVLINQYHLQPSAEFPLHVVEMSPLKIAIKYSNCWTTTGLNKDYQFKECSMKLSTDNYLSVAMFAEGKMIASTPDTVFILDSKLNVKKNLPFFNLTTQVRVFYSKEKRQLIILHDDIDHHFRGIPNTILKANELFIRVCHIKYDDEFD